MGRKAEGGIYVNKPLTGRFESIPILYSQHIAWSRNTVCGNIHTQDFIEFFRVFKISLGKKKETIPTTYCLHNGNKLPIFSAEKTKVFPNLISIIYADIVLLHS